MNSRVAYALGAVVLVAVVVIAGLSMGLFAPLFGDGYDPDHGDAEYDHVEVTVVDGETGAELGAVDAAVADTFEKRYLGLSDTEALPEDRGMLFVHDDPGQYTYVMRGMSFGIDIIYIDSDGTITEIHEAPEPGPDEDGNDQEYPGEGQYILEVNIGWSAERGIEPGDRVEFDL